MHERPRVFVARPPEGRGLDRLRGVADVDLWDLDRPPTPGELMARGRGAIGMLTSVSNIIDTELLTRCPDLRVVANMAVGYDNFDLAAMTRHGVIGTNTPGVLTDATADLTLALVLACARRIVEARDSVLAGEWTSWNASFMLGLELAGATLGIVGTGRIGLAVAARARAFSMRVLGTARHDRDVPGVDMVSLKELLGASDIVSLHVPLDESTRHLIGAREFALMKPSAYLVNTARGAVVDEAALVAALESGTIAGAGLDVFEREPLRPDAPLLAAPHVVALPHIGSATTVTRARMGDLAVANLVAAVEGGMPPNCLNPEAGRRPKGTELDKGER